LTAYQWVHLGALTMVAGALIAGIMSTIIAINAMLPG
jgi:hypothetical protein